MSQFGCWNCDSMEHHRRDCDEDVEEGTAAQTKKEASMDYKRATGKTQAEKAKWAEKQQIAKSAPLPRGFLRVHIEACCQKIVDVEYEVSFIGEIDEKKYESQLAVAQDVFDKFKVQMKEMREVVAFGKKYLRGMRESEYEEEDRMFRYSLQYLDEVREPTYVMLSRLVSSLKEFKRQNPIIEANIAAIQAEFHECRVILGERSPSTPSIENVLGRMKDVTPLISECSLKIRNLQKIVPAYKDAVVDTLNSDFNAIWQKRKNQAEQALDDLQTSAHCIVCFENGREVALICGHQLCLFCLSSLRNQPVGRNICPMCKGQLKVAVKLYA